MPALTPRMGWVFAGIGSMVLAIAAAWVVAVAEARGVGAPAARVPGTPSGTARAASTGTPSGTARAASTGAVGSGLGSALAAGPDVGSGAGSGGSGAGHAIGAVGHAVGALGQALGALGGAGTGSSFSPGLADSLGPEAGLEVEARPRTFPLLGHVFAALARPGAPRTAPLGLARYAWGGETISVARLHVPDALLDVPLVLTADGEGGYLLTTERGVALADGAVGTEVRGRDPAGGVIRILVTELVARPGTEFVVRKRGCADAISAARARASAR